MRRVGTQKIGSSLTVDQLSPHHIVTQDDVEA